MIIVSYDPFKIEGGTLYKIEKDNIIDTRKGIPSTISDLANSAVKFAHLHNDYDIKFKSEFGHDMNEFVNAIDCYEMMTFNENKITVEEVK